MDVTHQQSSLTLGFHAHAPPRALFSDESIFVQVDPGFGDSPRSARSVALQLLDQPEDPRENSSAAASGGDDSDDELREEKFSVLGYTMRLRKRKESESSSSISSSTLHPPKRALAEPDIEARRAATRAWGNQSLAVADPDIYEIMEKEKQRQFRGIELVASENFVCRAVLDALGTHITNKYSEGLPGSRYYIGNQCINQIERLRWERALAAFNLDPKFWGVNVQPYSCTSANFAVYTRLLLPKDRIMGLDSPSGGHVSHGYHTPSGMKISGASIFFESLSYKVNPHTGYIDYDKLEENALDFRPKILICGGSSHPREWDYARFRQIADRCGAVLMCDTAHISGLVVAKECLGPFDYCDIVTSITHKSLRGPRGGIIFYRKGRKLRKRGASLLAKQMRMAIMILRTG